MLAASILSPQFIAGVIIVIVILCIIAMILYGILACVEKHYLRKL